MADEQETKPVEKPGFDPSEILTKLEGIIKSNQKPAPESGGGGGSKSWISTLILIAVALAGVAIFSWLSWRKNRELAALRHEKEKARIEGDQAALRKEVADSAVEIAESQKEIDAARESVRIIEADIRAAEERHEADRAAIDRIRSWDDVPSPR